MDIIDIVLSKKYTDESIKGITGTLAGKNCTIKSATKADGVTTVVFAWTADDGTEKTTTIQVNDGAKGEIGDKGDIGISIDNVTINANSHLIVTLSDGSTIDAGLIQGGSGTDDYEDLINRPKIEGVDLIGNKTFEDLGVASATDLAQTDGHLQDLADLVGDKANLPMPNDTVVNNIEYVDTKVDGLIDDNITGLTKTFSSDKIAKTFATLEEVNERIPQYEIMPTATESCGGQVIQFIGTSTSDYTHGYFYECVPEGSGYIWKNIGVQAIPVKLSELTNDSGYITVNVDNLVNYYLKTETYSQAEVDEIIGKLNRLTTEIVTALPTENISTTTIYLIKVGETNNYTQHMYIGDAWADLGSTTIDLSGYVSKQQLTTTLADYVKSTDLQAHVDNNTVHLTIEDRDNLTNLLLDEHNHGNKKILDGILQAQVDNWNEAFTDKHTHDNKTVLDGITSTKVSDWDSAKTHADSAHAPSNAQENVLETVKVNGTALEISNKAVNVTVPTTVAELNDSADYAKKTDVDKKLNNKADKTEIPTVPTNVSEFTNDAGYLTEHQDISNLVVKEEGKGLSSNDYTSEEKTKLGGVGTSQGRNLIHYPYYNGTSYELNGITYTVNEADGTITVNGTATKESDFRLINPYEPYGRKTLELGQTYTLSDGVNQRNGIGYKAPVYFQFVRIDTTKNDFNYGISTNYGNMTWTASDANLLQYGIRIVVRSGVTVDNVVLKPMLEIGAIAHSYEPTTESNVNLKEAVKGLVTPQGKNLISYPYTSKEGTGNGITWTVNDDGTITADGTATNNSFFNLTNYIVGTWDTLHAGTYTIMDGVNLPIGGVTLQIESTSGTQYKNKTFTIEQDVVYKIFIYIPKGTVADNITFKPMLEVGSIAHMYEPTTESNISLKSAIDGKADKSEVCVNMLNPTLKTSTLNGITCTNNGDGTYTFTGTATGTATFIVRDMVDFVKKHINKDIRLVGCPKNGGVGNKYRLQFWGDPNSTVYDVGNGGNIHFKNITENANIAIIIDKGITATNLVFKPMLTTNLSATYDDFVPYTGDGETLASDVAEIKNDLGGLSFSASGTTLSITDGTNTWTLKANS